MRLKPEIALSEIAMVACIAVIAILGIIATSTERVDVAMALATGASIWPLVVAAPMTWASRIDQQHYLEIVPRAVWTWPLLMIVAGFSSSSLTKADFPVGAAVLAVATASLFVVRMTWSGRSRISRPGVFLATGAAGAAGLVADDYSVGWATMSFLVYGLVAFVVVSDLLAPQATSPSNSGK